MISKLPGHLGGHNNIHNIDEGVLNYAINNLKIKSFLDIGCGLGGMVELADKKGLISHGIDGDFTVKRYNEEKFTVHDFSIGPVENIKKYDLAYSVEFVEHVYEKFIPNYMPAFQKCSHVIMTFAPPGTGGYHHVNEQPEEYWLHIFDTYGFILDKEKTHQLRNCTTMFNGGKFRKFIKNHGLYFKKK